MEKYIYLFLLSVLLISCSKNIDNNNIDKISSDNNIEKVNIDNKNIIKEEALIDDTTDQDINQLIDILFDTNY